MSTERERYELPQALADAAAGRKSSPVEALAERLAEAVDGFTPYERDSDASGTPPSFYLRDGSGQVFQVTVTAFTCRVCGGVMSQARSALGLTLCSGACHRKDKADD